MFRKLTVLALLLTAGSVVVEAPAEAASAAVKSQKKVVKGVEKQKKTFDKLLSKWDKATAKGKSTASIDAEINAIVRSELARLRQKGIKSKADRSEEGRDTSNEVYRNALAGAQNAKRPPVRRAQLGKVSEHMGTIVMRQQRVLDKLKG